MRLDAVPGLFWYFLMFALAGIVHVADESFGAQFLGSPLLILVAVIVIAALASLYHRIRK